MSESLVVVALSNSIGPNLDKPLKGLVLAAGFGTRLKPFTETMPKPMFPLFGVTLAEQGVLRLTKAGVEEIAINIHHHAEKFLSMLQATAWMPKLHYSIEQPDILGRGGAISHLSSWLNGDDIIVYNGDIASDIDVSALITAHYKQKNAATMMVLPKPLGRDNAIYCRDGKVIDIAKSPPSGPATTPHGFACLHLLSAEFCALIPPSGFSDILDSYREALRQGMAIGAVTHHGLWFGIESLNDAWQAHQSLMNSGLTNETCDIRKILALRQETYQYDEKLRVFIGPYCHVDRDRLDAENVVLTRSVSITGSAKLRNVLMLPGASVTAGESFSNVAIGIDEQGKRWTYPLADHV